MYKHICIEAKPLKIRAECIRIHANMISFQRGALGGASNWYPISPANWAAVNKLSKYYLNNKILHNKILRLST